VFFVVFNVWFIFAAMLLKVIVHFIDVLLGKIQ